MTGRTTKLGLRAGLLLTGTVVLCVVAGCALLILRGDEPKNGIRVEQMGADLNERLPDGSTWAQAETWLASHGIQAQANIDPEGRKVCLHAIVPNDSFLESAEIRIELHFSPEGRLQKRVFYRFVYEL